MVWFSFEIQETSQQENFTEKTYTYWSSKGMELLLTLIP